MAQQTIGIGAAANDGTGDPIRTAFDKTNQNFSELYATDLATLEAVRDMLATALVPGANITITPNDGADTITIAHAGGIAISDVASLQAALDAKAALASPSFTTLVDNSGPYKVAGVQVVTSRRTGWSSPTGTASRAAFDTSGTTVSQLAQRLKAIIDDLSTHGLIGT